jgi:hypothetical protein
MKWMSRSVKDNATEPYGHRGVQEPVERDGQRAGRPAGDGRALVVGFGRIVVL